MRRSQFFLPTLREEPSEAKIVSHRLMLRAGLIDQTVSGIYSWLPLGARVLQKIEKIICEEQERIGAQRLIMPTIQPASLWEESGRYHAYGEETLRIRDRHNRDMLYGPSHEEVVTDIVRKFVKSYKQLPLNLFQIHWKFRDEIRPRFGVMRGREFLMKDGYSFDIDFESAKETYKQVFNSYIKIFDRIFKDIPDPFEPTKMIKVIPLSAETGAIGGNLSHEFQVIAATGESQLYYDKAHDEIADRHYDTLKDLYAAADALHDPAAVSADKLKTSRGIEVGHIFYFGQKYTKAMQCALQSADMGKTFYPECGSYGIGVSRLVGAIIETSHDDKGIVWPESVAPFRIGLINLLKDATHADAVYNQLCACGHEVLYDDRQDVSSGVKFADMDLIGLPYQVVIGKQYLESKTFTYRCRRTGQDVSSLLA